ncbi:choline transporter-like protein 2 isoform X2 [Strongylocentrotus purpuratus]|uniref:Choline transporter-like protein n=1 Tax=Strongylocentrotus purpuratus TaxID=7668 RepID=A0A7M7PK53_STRPU|nr:choline transporter-like protein 2 isoform X2 [Strongylocentrotus purpuratus]
MGKDKHASREELAEYPPETPSHGHSSGKYGTPKKYDPSFHGPIKNRSCTDVICCILFIVAVGGMIGVGVLGWMYGDPMRLIHPTDSFGQVCGIDENVKNASYLFYFDLLECFSSITTTVLNFGCPTPKICMSECPQNTFAPYTLLLQDAQKFIDELELDLNMWDEFICLPGFDPEAEFNDASGPYYQNLAKIFEHRKCATYYLPSTNYADRCVPAFLVAENASLADIFTTGLTNLQTLGGTLIDNDNVTSVFSSAVDKFLNLASVLEVVYEDFVNSWHIILIGLGIGMVLSMIWCFIMRWIAGVMVWGSILCLHAVLAAGIYCCVQQYLDLQGVAGSMDSITFEFTTNLSSYTRLQQTWLIIGIILCVVFLILFLLTICLCSRIRIAVELISESSKAVSSMWSTLFWPIVPFLLQTGVIALWVGIAVYLATSQQAMYQVFDATTSNFTGDSCDIDTFTADYNLTSNDTDLSCLFIDYSLPEYFKWLQLYNLFVFFWLINFVIGLSHMTLAGAFASYYWAFNKKDDVPFFALSGAFYRSLRYHLGTIAFGSLIIAIIQIIRVLLEYAEYQLKGKENKVAKFILRCMKCCFYCLEKFMKFINKNAYILVAVYGKNFCSSAKEAFFLLLRNIVRVAVVNKITDFLLFLGQLLIVSLVVVGAFFYFTLEVTWVNAVLPVPAVNYYWVVIIVIGIGVYLISKAFFGVFDMAVDTLFLSFLEDIERHDGSAEKPYYMSKGMMKIVGKKNKKMEEEW